MDKFQTLTGEQLVALGAKKVNCSLPEVGLKDVVPNGSWLEQKQVQNALEARRHVVEVERIEKRGTLSQAEWDEKLNLAEVSKKAGGHWQYVGHNVGRNLFLYPEEALLLMEMNCLQLTYNGVTVSIQQAYSLLLKDNSSLLQYKVYASLSRIGYKVFRHDMNHVKHYDTENIDSTTKVEQPSTVEEIDITEKHTGNDSEQKMGEVIQCAEDKGDNKLNNTLNADTTTDSNEIAEVYQNANENMEDENIDAKTDDNILSENDAIENITNGQNTTKDNKKTCLLNDVESIKMETENIKDNVEVRSSVNLCDDDDSEEKSTDPIKIESIEMSDNRSIAIMQNKIDILSSRELRPCDSNLVHECFNENLPDLYQKHIVTVKAPEEQYIPRNVFLNNTAYVLNLENLKLKSVTPVSSSNTPAYISDEVNDQHVRRIRSGCSNESAQSNFSPQFFPRMRFSQQSHQYRPFNYWNQFNYNWTYQRPFFQMPFRFQIFPRMQPMFRFFPPTPMFHNTDNPTRRPHKRKRDNPKKYHLESIKNLASKLKSLVASGNRQEDNVQALQRLIETYNTRYRTRLELTDQLDVLENEIILVTIDLDDDDQSQAKKKKNEDLSINMYDENFQAVKKLSAKLKELEAKNILSARHRRAFSNVIRTFNKSYNADIYVDSNYEVTDRRHIVIPSSSDSECTVEEIPADKNVRKRRRSTKLRNPFYILKQLSEKQNSTERSVDSNESGHHSKKKFEYSHILRSVFSKEWLPSEDDFGRAEVPLRSEKQMDHSENFLYEFVRSQPAQFNNWLNAKIAYWQSCKESALKFEAQSQSESKIKLDSIVKVEDCTDLRSVLKKLSVIRTSKNVQEECSLTIHFDVYQRNVPNFRKSKKPKPHFRIICIGESSAYPTGQELATLHSKYKDDVGIVFAIVGTSSISYLQINPVDLPIYIPATNMPL